MTNKLKNWLSARRPPLPSFRFMFTMMYLGVIGSIAYFNLLMNCGRRFLGGGAAMLAIIFLLLVGLEQLEQKRYRYEAPMAVAGMLLLARVVLFEGVALLDCSAFSLLLYPIIPFSAYFTFGAGVSGVLSVFSAFIALSRAWHLTPTWYMSPAITVILVAFLFILAFMQGMARVISRDEQSRRRTEQLLADLEDSHVKLQAYARQVGELAATEERNRLARDIHDSVGHYLTAVSIQLEKALAYRERSPEEATQAIRDAKQAASEALRDVRHSVSALRSAEGDFSLKRALEDLVKGIRGDGLAIDLNMTGDEEDYNRFTLMVLYRAAQEGLTNIQQHARARHVVLEVALGEQAASLRLKDDGQGFDIAVLAERALARHNGFGLQGIRERLDLVEGHMSVKSTPSQGTELLITAPKQLVTLATRAGRSADLRRQR